MEKLRDKYISDPKYQGKCIKGYIQELSVSPFYVLMYTERVLLYLIEMSKKEYFPLYLDGTGTIIEAPKNQNRPLYYTLLIKSSTSERDQTKPALPILEFISTVHNVPYLTMILAILFNAIQSLNESKELVLRHIEMDFSMAEIQATLKAFNEMTVNI